MTKITDTDTIIRKIRDNFYEVTKDMTMEERCQHIYKQGKELQQKWKNVQLSKQDSDPLKNKIKIDRNRDAEQLVCWVRDQIYEDTKDMTPEEQTNYINKRYENLRKHWTLRNTTHAKK
jgi:hypothetical protein